MAVDARPPHPEFLHVDWRVSGIEARPGDGEEATEEGNFGVRVDVCPRDKSNEIHYNREVSCAPGRRTCARVTRRRIYTTVRLISQSTTIRRDL